MSARPVARQRNGPRIDHAVDDRLRMHQQSNLVRRQAKQIRGFDDLSPLFIIDAESIVIFWPMLQFGCFSAFAIVALSISALSQVGTAPP